MSTEYENLANTKLTAWEHSSLIDLYVDQSDGIIKENMDSKQLCELAEELIKLASYISEDSQEILNAYGIDYNNPKWVSVM